MTQPTDSRAAIQELLGKGPIAYYRVFAAVGGGVTSGVLLSQLFYWHDKTRDPQGWIFKTQDQWQQETGLTRREQETARRNLRERGLIDEKLAGIPARLHYRLNVDRLITLLAQHRRRRLADQPGAPEHAPAPTDGGEQASSNLPDKHGATRPSSTAESANQARTDAPDKPARTRQSRMAERARQARHKPPDKPGGIRQASPAESANHAKTTRDHGREYGTQYGTQYNTQHPKEHSQSAQKAAASPMQAFCSLHEQPMHRRQKDGDTWYSHRLPNGAWCRGAPGDQPKDDPGAPGRERRRRYATQFADSGFRLGAYAPDGDEPDGATRRPDASPQAPSPDPGARHPAAGADAPTRGPPDG